MKRTGLESNQQSPCGATEAHACQHTPRRHADVVLSGGGSVSSSPPARRATDGGGGLSAGGKDVKGGGGGPVQVLGGQHTPPQPTSCFSRVGRCDEHESAEQVRVVMARRPAY
eukprot:45094-Eustigmatos_ZCMA.PRE.1